MYETYLVLYFLVGDCSPLVRINCFSGVDTGKTSLFISAFISIGKSCSFAFSVVTLDADDPKVRGGGVDDFEVVAAIPVCHSWSFKSIESNIL